MLRSSLVAVAALALVLFTPRDVFAQDNAAAEALFRSAQQAARQGDWVTACDRFEESNRLDPAPGTVLNIARCREQLGQLASAWQAYQEAGERLPSTDRRSAFAKGKAKELHPRVPRVTFLAPLADDGKEFQGDYVVTINGTTFNHATFSVALPFDPGKVRITISAPGHEDLHIEITAKEGQSQEQRLRIGPEAASTDAVAVSAPSDAVVPDASPAQQGSGRRTAGIVLLTAGGVGVATAAAGGIWAAVELPNVKEPYCVDGVCGQDGWSASKRGRTAVILTGVGAGVAVLGLGLGSYFLATSSGKSSSAEPHSFFDFTPLRGGGFISLQTPLGSDMLPRP